MVHRKIAASLLALLLNHMFRYYLDKQQCLCELTNTTSFSCLFPGRSWCKRWKRSTSKIAFIKIYFIYVESLEMFFSKACCLSNDTELSRVVRQHWCFGGLYLLSINVAVPHDVCLLHGALYEVEKVKRVTGTLLPKCAVVWSTCLRNSTF